MIINSYLVNIVNCMKIKGHKVQVDQLMTFKFGKNTKKMKYSKYLFSWHGRFQISTTNTRTSLFQVKGSDVEHNLLFNFCNLLILVFFCKKKRYFSFRAFIYLLLGAFNVFYVKFVFLGINQELFYIIFSYLSSFTNPLNGSLSLYTFFEQLFN